MGDGPSASFLTDNHPPTVIPRAEVLALRYYAHAAWTWRVTAAMDGYRTSTRNSSGKGMP